MNGLPCRKLAQPQCRKAACTPHGLDCHSHKPLSTHVRTCRQGRAVCAHAETSGGFGDGLKRLGKRIQGGLPIVGLFSRLAAPDGGGFEEQTYPEYCRAKLEEGSIRMNCATADLNAAKGKVGSRKIVLFITWMIQQGCGLVPDRYFVLSARRLNASQDLEAEMYRFEATLEVEREKYSMMEPPAVDRKKQVVVAVDALATCCLGLREEADVSTEDSKLLLEIVASVFPDVPEEEVKEAIASKAQRTYK